MKFLLDTDTCIHILKQRRPALDRLLEIAPRDVGISVVTEAELQFGAAKSGNPSRTRQGIASFLAPLTILPLESEDVPAYAHIQAHLEKCGKPIGPLDTLIAAQGVSRGLVVVTANRREFSRVPDLLSEDWTR